MIPRIRQRKNPAKPKPPDWTKAFGRRAPLHVDLGAGRGHFALERARRSPDVDLIAIEYKRKWVQSIQVKAMQDGLSNLRAIRCDARHDLPLLFAPESIAGLTLLHPDPWWKKRHRKRRLVQPGFVEYLGLVLAPHGWVYMQTDVPDLLAEMSAVFQASSRFEPMDADRVLQEHLQGVLSHRAAKCKSLGIPFGKRAFGVVTK
jgi:tRNA (guanine-N7-)-methyltransferase